MARRCYGVAISAFTAPAGRDPGDPASLTALATRYPLTCAAFAAMPDGQAALRAALALERRWQRASAGEVPAGLLATAHGPLPPVPAGREYDVIVAGGGLGLLAGYALARFGHRTLVFDRDGVGAAHREWNISRRELAALVDDGLFTWPELDACVATTYDYGVLSFDATGAGGRPQPLRLAGVLDTALDAQALLTLARRRFLAAGGEILEGRRFLRLTTAAHGPARSVVEVRAPDGAVARYGARLVIDMMGSISPIALALNRGHPFDGVCPTAGTVVRGLDAPPAVGDVLVTVAGTQAGRQLIWEGFPGHDGQTTVYLFYYDRAGPAYAPAQSLLALFEQYFALLHTYRPAGAGFAHLRPVYGYIPARHGRRGITAARGLICLGDAAAAQSPLTFCGFGSNTRSLPRVSRALDAALRRDRLEARDLRRIGPQQDNLRPTWAFARLMQPWPGAGPHAVNGLMNAFCGALAATGPARTVRFLQDRHTFADYLRILLTTARRHPAVFAVTWRALGPGGMARWLRDIAAFGVAALWPGRH
jgi:lycopene cyclase CruA